MRSARTSIPVIAAVVAMLGTLVVGAPAANAQLDDLPRWRLGAPQTLITRNGHLDEFLRLSEDRVVIMGLPASITYFDLTPREPEVVIASPTLGRPVAMGIIGDTIWVADMRRGLVLYLSATGEVIGQRGEVRYRTGGEDRFGVPRALLREGWSVVADFVDGLPADELQAMADTSYPVLLISPGGRAVDTLMTRFVTRTKVMIIDDGAYLRYQPFSADPIWEDVPDGSGVVVVHRAVADPESTARFNVRRLNANGNVTFDRAYDYRPKAITAQIVDSVIDVAVGMVLENQPWRLDVRPTIARQLYVPRAYPPVTDLMVARNGTTWLRVNTTSTKDGTYLVLDPAGEPLGLVELGDRLRPVDASDTDIWVTEQIGGAHHPEYRLSRIPYRR